ncbi:hypothetical protein SAMN05421783_102151 [Thiocapsa roseopersicina]|uniref:Uncharacterized protein n=1 Tax=Thiocapsa roseopersicina TaxID=1058 RepID=A0A1H2RSF1_THIRO|nr:hypothetical protein SAMN05421783_102151 [Thiocapsa roseopersicina]
MPDCRAALPAPPDNTSVIAPAPSRLAATPERAAAHRFPKRRHPADIAAAAPDMTARESLPHTAHKGT